MWRNGRRKGLKIPRGGPVPVRVRSQAPPTEVSPFWRKYMRPLLCLIFFRSFGSLPPPCCDRTVRNSDAHALCRRRDKPSPVGVRYSVATLRFAPYESGHKHQRFKLGLKRSENGSLAQVPLPFFRLALRHRFPLRLCHRRTKSWAPDGASNVNRSKLQSGAFAKKYIIL